MADVVASRDGSSAGEGPAAGFSAVVYTDIDGSTGLWERHPDLMPAALARHNRLIESIVDAAGGTIVKNLGDGFLAVFDDAESALAAATQIEGAIDAADWGLAGDRFTVRVAIDLGEIERSVGDIAGPAVNRCSRILEVARRGQILISDDVAERTHPDDVTFVDLGEFPLRGVEVPVGLHRVEPIQLPSRSPEPTFPESVAPTGVRSTMRGFELREQIGTGVAGVVYRAHQRSVDREVAIKLIRPEYANDRRFIRRFETEAQFIARLEHPHIVSLYDYWRDPDGAYLVMRWLRGGSLRQALTRGPWHTQPALELLHQVGSALAYAHRHGVIHRDVRPSNVLLDEDGNGYLSDFGIASRPITEGGISASTSPEYRSPEETDGGPLTEATDQYCLGLLAHELFTGERPGHPHTVELPSGVNPSLTQAITRATAPDPADRYPTIEAFLTAIGPPIDAAGVEIPVSRNPFKGLRPFFEADAEDYCGRQPLIDRLIHTVEHNRLVSVIGASGSGKSSAVRAGLVPALRTGAISGSDQWLITDLYPGAHPFDELAPALLSVSSQALPDLASELRQDPRALGRVVKQVVPADSEIILIIDQFEELFTLATPEDQTAFVGALTELINDPHARARVVVTLRADFYDRPLAFSEFAPLIEPGLVSVPAPTREELTAAITEPSLDVGLTVEPALVELILSEIVDRPGALPLLQYTLTELFEAREGSRLTAELFATVGGVRGSLGRRAESIFTSLAPAARTLSEQVFLRLVSVEDNADDTRRRVTRANLDELSPGHPVIEEVLDAFGRHRLLTFDHDPNTRDPTVELAHEAILRAWPRLAGWIDERRQDLVTQHHLAATVGEWEQSGREADHLLTGGRLAHFETWGHETDLTLTESELALLSESRVHENLREARRHRVRRLVMAAFGVVAVIATVFALFALNERSRAEENEIAAEQARIEAEDNAVEAERQRALAEANAEEARQRAAEASAAAAVARSRELAASAIATLDEDPELSILLAIEAAEIADPPPAAVEALHRAVQSDRSLFVHEFEAGAAEWAATRDGSLLALTTDGARVQIVEALTGVEVGQFGIDPEARIEGCSNVVPWGGASAVAFSPDGMLLAAALGDGQVHLYDLGAATEIASPVPQVLETFGPDCFNYVSIEFTPDGTGIAVATQLSGESATSWTENLVVWPLAGGPATYETTGFPNGITASLDPSGRFAAMTDFWNFYTTIVDLTGSTPDLVLDGTREQTDAIFTPDGTRVITVARDRLAKLWDLSTGDVIAEFDGAETALAISDNDLLATAAFDGVIRVWDIETEELVATFDGHRGVVTDVHITADGSTVISGGFEDGTIRVWDLARTGEAEVIGTRLEVARLTGMDLSSTDAVVLTRPAPVVPGSSFVVDLESFKTAELPNQFGYGLSITPDGSAYAAEDVGDAFFGPIQLRDLETGELRGVPLEINKCEETVAEGADEPEIVCPPYPEPGHWLFPIEIDISPDQRYLAAGGLGNPPDPDHAAVFDLQTGELLQTWAYSSQYHHGVRFTPDGRHLAVGSNGDVRLYEVGSWEETLLIEYDGDAKHLDFTPDGSLIAIGGEATNLVVVADTSTGEELYRITDHQGDVTDLQFSEDGSLLLTASTDGTIRLWTMATGESALTVPLDTTGYIFAQFDPRNPDHIVFAREDGLMGILTTNTDELLDIARSRVQRDFTPAECERFALDDCRGSA